MKIFFPFLLFVVFACGIDSGKEKGEHADHAVCARIPSRSAALAIGETKSADGIDNNAENKNMVWVEGGEFIMGSKEFKDAQPLHKVKVDGFWMDAHEVTNAQFAKFVKATGYMTVAERELNPADFPGVPLENLVPGSAVFNPPAHITTLNDPLQWWKYIAGANWKHPKGPGSDIKEKDNYPVVQVCYEDAAAYAKWAGKRLPTEAEWEFAARGKDEQLTYYWGASLKPQGKWRANIYQGNFPVKNTAEDGFEELAPVKSFASNENGLYDMEGNVWEWCSDLYRPDYYQNSSRENPQGPSTSHDPMEPGITKHVQRGGSYMCSDQYCDRYKAGSRGKGETSSASNNLGFRCAK